MSARPSRRVRERWRRQAAQLAGLALYGDSPCLMCAGSGLFGANTATPSACDGCGGTARRSDCAALTFAAGLDRFDVALVRGYCERLIVEGERLARELETFSEWTRTRGRNYATTKTPAQRRAVGMGPENVDLGAFVLDSWAYANSVGRKHLLAHGWISGEHSDGRWPMVQRFRGGWPGPLAREYGWERCKACKGATAVEWTRATLDGWYPVAPGIDEPTLPWLGKVTKRWRVAPGGFACRLRPSCAACRGRGRTRKPGIPPGFANGDSIARTARRLLDTLDGRCPWNSKAAAQPTGCADASGRANPCVHGHGRVDVARVVAEFGSGNNSLLREAEAGDGTFACRVCRGSGHNLAGVLPPVEVRPRWRPLAPVGTVPRPGQFAEVVPEGAATTIAGIAAMAYLLRPPSRRTPIGDALARGLQGMLHGSIARRLMQHDLAPPDIVQPFDRPAPEIRLTPTWEQDE